MRMIDHEGKAIVDGSSTPVKSELRTCRSCKRSFDVYLNHPEACSFHPESFCGETAQRWLAPGETEGGGVIHNFYSCCGNPDKNSRGCCVTSHKTFDEVDNEWGRRPGMGKGKGKGKGEGEGSD